MPVPAATSSSSSADGHDGTPRARQGLAPPMRRSGRPSDPRHASPPKSSTAARRPSRTSRFSANRSPWYHRGDAPDSREAPWPAPTPGARRRGPSPDPRCPGMSARLRRVRAIHGCRAGHRGTSELRISESTGRHRDVAQRSDHGRPGRAPGLCGVGSRTTPDRQPWGNRHRARHHRPALGIAEIRLSDGDHLRYRYRQQWRYVRQPRASFSMVADPPGCRGSRTKSSSPSRKSALVEPEARSRLSGSDAYSGRAGQREPERDSSR